ncbi:hypothetical protein [Clostridium taeniosporum]|uniref:AMP-activated protein kinase glycogen-binding domain-containing protein n=1 Tax=Clostridium taeniosporum TaxID=394958 RepID=A0A1D7XHS0_9CLOT|nr:hypothetical protein [Clostridium taeniosporum]AOR22629.1 hypothetical protein BGI42_02410 [Clostridium taeniosporum]
MEIIFEYEEKGNLEINSVAVIGSFNNYDPAQGSMIKEGSKWIFKCDLLEGEHYYKFLINNELKLNDPSANVYLPDDNEELWSVIIINNNNQRLYNNNQYTVHVDSYNVTCNINEEQKAVNKKIFNVLLDKKIVTRFGFTNVSGLHSVTTAWFTPKGELYQVVENNLFATKENEKDPILMWFWMDLNNSHRSNCGLWTVKLFIDGEFVLEDQVRLLENTSYTAQGKMN